uniref:Apple domain-containing protein n=1 Tax=Tetranychus urticae TaxID=32264 RepID=T1K411_TETUR
MKTIETGYHARIELVNGAGHLLEVEESFNSQNSFGLIKLNDDVGNEQRSFWYYLESKEFFYIDSDQSCTVSTLNDQTKKSIISEWLAFNSLPDETSIFDDPKNLGPILLFLYLASKSNDLQYTGTVDLDGRKCNSWFYCLHDDGPYFDVYFDTNDIPVRLVSSYPDNPTLTTTINIINFEPLINQPSDLITYPYGYGCKRTVTTSVPTPIFAQSDTFNLDLEAALSFTEPDRSAITTARIVKYQGIYSYDLKENGITKRIIHDPKLLIDFQVDPLTGTCVEGQASVGVGYGFTYLRWPYFDKEKFNILDDSVMNLGSVSYMGQIRSETGRLDVFEKQAVNFFYLDGSKYSAIITYFFPASYDKRVSTRNQAPTKIIIKPGRELSQFKSDELVNRIEVKVISYHESSIDFENRFDISGCFNGQGDYTWFQIVFSGRQTDLASWMNQDEYLKEKIRSALSFIPMVRLPDIRVSFIGNMIYITCKLIERPSYEYDFYKTPGFTISNPSRIILRDHEQDCGEVCAEDEDCTNFAYCNNLECRIFSQKKSTYPQIVETSDCDGFGRNNYFVNPKTEVESNFLKSSKSLIHEIKAKITNGDFNFKEPALSALFLFIVSGPDQLGDPDSILGDDEVDDIISSVGDHYQVVLSNRRLLQGNAVLGLDYLSCLTECDNDDSCLVVSFCSSRKGECILGNSTQDVNEDSTALSKGCNILSKSYLTYFRKFPGRSLILDAEQILKNTGKDECARICAQSTSQPCESFDYCPEAGLNQKGSKKIKACFLHNFHIAKDTSSTIDGKVWNFNETKCDHYAKVLSKDYKQLIGLKFNDNMKDSILVQTSGISLERCAGSCSTSGNCESYDFCEVKTQSGQITSKCRLSSSKPNSKSSQSIENSLEKCSIYLTSHSEKSEADKSSSKIWMFIFLSCSMFICAFVIGIIGARYYFKR